MAKRISIRKDKDKHGYTGFYIVTIPGKGTYKHSTKALARHQVEAAKRVKIKRAARKKKAGR